MVLAAELRRTESLLRSRASAAVGTDTAICSLSLVGLECFMFEMCVATVLLWSPVDAIQSNGCSRVIEHAFMAAGNSPTTIITGTLRMKRWSFTVRLSAAHFIRLVFLIDTALCKF